MFVLLLAQAAADIPTWLSPLANYGVLGIFALVVFYFMLTYGRKFADKHLAFMETAEKCLASNTRSLEALTKSHGEHEHNCSKLPKMLAHLAEAGKAATDCPDVHRHLDRVLDERDRV